MVYCPDQDPMLNLFAKGSWTRATSGKQLHLLCPQFLPKKSIKRPAIIVSTNMRVYKHNGEEKQL